MREVKAVSDFASVKYMGQREAVCGGLLHFIGEEIDCRYLSELKKLVQEPELLRERARELKIAVSYTHLIFMQRWSELMWDMLIAPNIQMQTLNVLISTQFKPMGAFPGPMYAASVILTLPIIILFLCFSKYFKEGISFMLK